MPTQHQVDYHLQIARTALERGDALLQLQIEVGYLTGEQSSWGSSDNTLSADPTIGWMLGEVEKLGWRLEHIAHSFVETGSSSSARILGTGEGTVNRGALIGMYVFRRAQ